MSNPLKDRLAKYSKVNEENGCLEWVRYTNPDGYGALWLNGGSERTHRAAWIAEHGAIPQGMHVLHKCDNRKCINLDHLFLGSNAENVADKVAKNRQYRPQVRGEDLVWAKLTDAKVRLIRMLPRSISNSRWAREFGVSIMAISMARNNKTWTHVQAGGGK